MLAALGTVSEPDLDRPITEVGMVRGVVVRPGRVQVSLALAVAAHPEREAIHRAVVDAIGSLGVDEVAVDFTTMTEADRSQLRDQLQGLRPEPTDALSGVRVVAVASGKGGVGKSSLSVNLAVAMARRGRRVALIDADVWGFSLPRMLGVARAPLILHGLLVPLRAHGVRVMSVGFLADESSPVIWRGPMLHKLLEQFLTDVFWDDPEIVVVDLPPGTGDVALSLARLLPDAEVVVVTTPQPAAARVAQRAAYMARQVHLKVVGVIENMSWFTGNDGVRYELFGVGGGTQLAEQLDVPLLGQVPFVRALREGADLGLPLVEDDPRNEASDRITAVADRLLAMPIRRIRRPDLKVIS